MYSFNELGVHANSRWGTFEYPKVVAITGHMFHRNYEQQ